MLLNLQVVVKDRVEKIWIILSGRDYEETPVWRQGNFLRVKFSPYQKVVESVSDAQVWKKLMALRQKYVTYKYRPYKDSNRHGSSNDNPSWWALGFQSRAEYMNTLTQSEQRNYLQNIMENRQRLNLPVKRLEALLNTL